MLPFFDYCNLPAGHQLLFATFTKLQTHSNYLHFTVRLAPKSNHRLFIYQSASNSSTAQLESHSPEASFLKCLVNTRRPHIWQAKTRTTRVRCHCLTPTRSTYSTTALLHRCQAHSPKPGQQARSITE